MLDLTPGQHRERHGREDESVDDEDLLPVALGRLVDIGMGAALGQEDVVPASGIGEMLLN
jgi:hypothetical protein